MAKLAIIILAAGKGTRMQSSLPKAMHRIAGRSMISHLLEMVSGLKPEAVNLVIGPGMKDVEEEALKIIPDAQFSIQKERLGTGHAVKETRENMENKGDITLILYGDTPFITKNTIKSMVAGFKENKNLAIMVLGFTPDDPYGYGRLKLSKNGTLCSIIEEKDANSAEKAINLCNSGVMAVKSSELFGFLGKLTNDNAKNEYYLTDVVGLAAQGGHEAGVLEVEESEVMGINSRVQLAEAEAVMQENLRKKAMENGVTLIAPETVFFADDTEYGKDVVIHPNVVFGKGVRIASNVEIRSFSHIEEADIADGAVIGPFARLRGGAEIAENVKIGNFVEVKNSKMGKGAKASHLSYIGDSELGEDANIGAGVITCNYNGFEKSKTKIGKGAFIGSNSALVAPVKIGDGAIVGAGSTITKDVPADALAINDRKQQNQEGRAKSYREEKLEKIKA